MHFIFGLFCRHFPPCQWWHVHWLLLNQVTMHPVWALKDWCNRVLTEHQSIMGWEWEKSCKEQIVVDPFSTMTVEEQCLRPVNGDLCVFLQKNKRLFRLRQSCTKEKIISLPQWFCESHPAFQPSDSARKNTGAAIIPCPVCLKSCQVARCRKI